jgi:hypothetical protein
MEKIAHKMFKIAHKMVAHFFLFCNLEEIFETIYVYYP